MANLAVASGWSPLGESIGTVINKLQNLNSLNHIEVKQLSLETSDTGWREESLRLSYPGDFPLFGRSENYQKWPNNLAWHLNMHICPQCYTHGVHLNFHQSTHWEKCPIHYTKLQDTCVSCGTSLGIYRYTNQREGYSCKQCGFNPFLVCDNWISKKIESAKESIATSYWHWYINVKKKIEVPDKNYLNSEYLWVTKPERTALISSYYRLFGGPRWMGKSLRHSKTTKLIRHVVRGKQKISRARRTTHATKIDAYHHRNRSYNSINLADYNDEHLYLRDMRICNTEEICTLFDQAADYVDSELVKSSPCINSIYDLYGYNHPCIELLHFTWRKKLKQWTSFGAGGISQFWGLWLSGPGRDLRISIPKNSPETIRTTNKDYTLAVTEIWMRTKLMEAARHHFSREQHLIRRDDKSKFALKREPSNGDFVLYEVRSRESLRTILKDLTCENS